MFIRTVSLELQQELLNFVVSRPASLILFISASFLLAGMADIVNKQKKSLVQTIKEAEKAELNRMKKLSLVVTSGERSVLVRRFEQERQRDQERIENLSKDFFTLQEKLQSGDLRELTERRNEQSTVGGTAVRQTDGHLKNRFVGLENHNDIIFHTAVCDKFGKYDEKFRQKINRPVYNANEEVHKLKLLNDKRNLLKQLVNIHVAEHGGLKPSARASTGGRSDYYTGRSGYSYAPSERSDSNYSRSSDKASYATFATNRPPSRTIVGGQLRITVPRLKIPVPDR